MQSTGGWYIPFYILNTDFISPFFKIFSFFRPLKRRMEVEFYKNVGQFELIPFSPPYLLQSNTDLSFIHSIQSIQSLGCNQKGIDLESNHEFLLILWKMEIPFHSRQLIQMNFKDQSKRFGIAHYFAFGYSLVEILSDEYDEQWALTDELHCQENPLTIASSNTFNFSIFTWINDLLGQDQTALFQGLFTNSISEFKSKSLNVWDPLVLITQDIEKQDDCSLVFLEEKTTEIETLEEKESPCIRFSSLEEGLKHLHLRYIDLIYDLKVFI